MKTDWYLRVVLTTIAAALLMIALRPATDPIVARAQERIQGLDEIKYSLDKMARAVDEMKDYGLKLKSDSGPVKVQIENDKLFVATKPFDSVRTTAK